MNQISNKAGKINNNIFFMVLAFILFSIGTAFAQNEVENTVVSNNTITTTTSETLVAKQESNDTNSNMNFVLWFMGSKQDPNVKISTEGVNTKKEFMTSGMAPNRLLIKAFLKKAVNFEAALS
ncbi:hypothetical protein C3L50_12735 [Flavobacterium alvei]|uniref:Uncharacterized protein n=1 Tax=Flavobacterium alvei TaxID=2080416 RepID=A0A2S5A6B1_9FLAO|nr:hypothetical protein [Flavobacterium alvei]POY38130.1 hypothetical protein C3L50_12735 [Flavobacterium alvei]